MDINKPPEIKKKSPLKSCAIIILSLAIAIFLFIFILISWGIPGKYKYHLTDEAGNPIPDATLNFEHDTKLNLGGKHSNGTKTIKLTTNKNGDASFWGFVKYRKHLTKITAKGFYPIKHISADKTNIILRKKVNPVPMYVNNCSLNKKDLGKIIFPGHEGEFHFDIIKHDFLPPYGKGEVTDFIFSLKSSLNSCNEKKISWDIIFDGAEDGIQYDFNTKDSSLSASAFQGRYTAPEKGYIKSYRQAKKNFYTKAWPRLKKYSSKEYERFLKYGSSEIKHKYKPVYYFRVRSNTSKPLYGKIYGVQGFSGQSLRKGLFELHKVFYLNPDGTRNMEHSRNLFKTK